MLTRTETKLVVAILLAFLLGALTMHYRERERERERHTSAPSGTEQQVATRKTKHSKAR